MCAQVTEFDATGRGTRVRVPTRERQILYPGVIVPNQEKYRSN